MNGQMQEAEQGPRDGAVGSGGRPIDALMRTALDSLKGMVDVNTILGVPVETPDGTVIIPVSRVSFGFVAGGSEFDAAAPTSAQTLPFGGGSGAGVSLSPVAFLVVGQNQVRLLPISDRAFYDRLLDVVVHLAEQVQGWVATQDGRDGRAEKAPGRAGMRASAVTEAVKSVLDGGDGGGEESGRGDGSSRPSRSTGHAPHRPAGPFA